jgi:hypothetical protein
MDLASTGALACAKATPFSLLAAVWCVDLASSVSSVLRVVCPPCRVSSVSSVSSVSCVLRVVCPPCRESSVSCVLRVACPPCRVSSVSCVLRVVCPLCVPSCRVCHRASSVSCVPSRFLRVVCAIALPPCRVCHRASQALLPLCWWVPDNAASMTPDNAASVARSRITEALVQALLDLLSWLALVQDPEVPTVTDADFLDRALQVERQIIDAIDRLPNGALFVLHPPSRPGWCQAMQPWASFEVRCNTIQFEAFVIACTYSNTTVCMTSPGATVCLL